MQSLIDINNKLTNEPAQRIKVCRDVTDKILTLENGNKMLYAALSKMKSQRDEAQIQLNSV